MMVGGLPPRMRVFATVRAASPPPPAIGLSIHRPPRAVKRSAMILSERASPPEVHQCRTSTVGSAAARGMNKADARSRPAKQAEAVTLLEVAFCLFITEKIQAPRICAAPIGCTLAAKSAQDGRDGLTRRRRISTSECLSEPIRTITYPI